MKKLFSSILFMILCVSLFAGGQKETDAAANSMAASSQPKEIQFWFSFSDDKRSGWIKDLAADWNASHTEYKIVAEQKGSYRETLQAAVLASRQSVAPHLVHVFEVGSQLAFDSGIFEPIGNIGSFDTSDYIQPVLNYYTLNGTVNSIPFNSSSPILYINEDMMIQAGLDPKNPPETFEEIIAACEKAKAAGVTEAGLGFNLHGWFYEQWLAEQGAPIVNNGNGRDGRATETMLDSKESKIIFNFIKELNDKGFYKYTGKLEDWGGSDAIFQEGKVMFHITSTADLGNISTAIDDRFQMGTGRLPIPGSSKRNGVVIGGASVWLTKGHPMDEMEAARDFILFLTNTENMMDWHKMTGYYPVRNSSIEKLEQEGWFTEAPTRTIAFTQLLETESNMATAGGLMGTFGDTRTIVEEAIQKVLNGADVDASIEQAKTLADLKLSEYNKNF
ncbi:ABC transporter substrate-binding protein [Oceanispirochaeta crateris]|uniref:sn-glycerol-3-phosphate-binding periplasmic protein UgpB n=1 Tax=Oceanispirochaeta crateris TaxID=2518645 RepID=A0A5C1QMS2_9SPIO|nr:ABC transporter substrate-binding protein [Oceanispirochaeta crateris]QEN08519.1 ABC transporter substrate-binding protein [Oceanispirochaeta crateris]